MQVKIPLHDRQKAYMQGRLRTKPLYPSGPSFRTIVPPCFSATLRQMESPRPLPFPDCREASPQTNGSKTESLSSSGIGVPLSHRPNVQKWPSDRTTARAEVPGGLWAMQFPRRFRRTLRISVRSMESQISLSGISVSSSMRRFSNAPY